MKKDIKTRFEERYASGNTPWDTGRPDSNLKKIIEEYKITGKRALDIGCGTGDNAIFLAQSGFQVTGTEIVDLARQKACSKASKAGINCEFLLKNIIENPLDEEPFDFVFDRGCFHASDSGELREKFVKAVAAHLKAEGYWLSLIGNADEKREGNGPPRRTATEIVTAVEPLFEIIMLKAGHFDSDLTPPPRNWILLAQKRS